MAKNMETFPQQINTLLAENKWLTKSKKNVQAELEYVTIKLESQIANFINLDRKQTKFDQNLAEWRAISERLSLEHNQADREIWNKEIEILNLDRDLQENNYRNIKLDRIRQTQAWELEDLVSSKDDKGKNVHDL